LGQACKLANEDFDKDHAHISALRKRLIDGVMEDIEEVYFNGTPEQSVPGIVNISFNYVEGESLLMALKDIAVSSGSACTSASLEPSYVLRALGRNDELAHSSIRFSIGRFTTEQEIDYTVKLIKDSIGRLREMSPLWEMFKEGIDLESVEWAHH
jgi:cysteine desulfurase